MKQNIDKEKMKELTRLMEERLRVYRKREAELKKQGYQAGSLLIGSDAGNRIALIMFLPVFAAGMFLFITLNPDAGVGFRTLSDSMIFLGSLFLLMVLRELVRGLAWSLFAENRLKDIEFGMLADRFTPYCACRSPLKKWQYMLGMLMPVILLGIVPTVIAEMTGSFLLLLIGLVMIIVSARDLLIVYKLAGYHPEYKDQLAVDHPNQPGLIIYER